MGMTEFDNNGLCVADSRFSAAGFIAMFFVFAFGFLAEESGTTRAGPGGAVPGKPVGTVWFGFAVPGQVLTEKRHFEGDRAAVRAATVRHALARLVQLLLKPE